MAVFLSGFDVGEKMAGRILPSEISNRLSLTPYDFFYRGYLGIWGNIWGILQDVCHFISSRSIYAVLRTVHSHILEIGVSNTTLVLSLNVYIISNPNADVCPATATLFDCRTPM